MGEIDTVYLDDNEDYMITTYDRNGDGLIQNGYYKISEDNVTLGKGSGNFGGIVEFSLQPENIREVKSSGENEANASANKPSIQGTATAMLLLLIFSILFYI